MTGQLEKTSLLLLQSLRQGNRDPLACRPGWRRVQPPLYRAKLAGPATPSSVIVIMELPRWCVLPLSSEELAIFKKPLKELPFLNVHRFLTRIGVKCRDSTTNRWTKDFYFGRPGRSSSMGQSARSAAVGSLGVVPKAIDELLVLQIRGTKGATNLAAFQQRFDFRLYMWEFDHFLEFGLEKRPGTNINQTSKQELKYFCQITQRLDSLFLLEPPRIVIAGIS